MKKSMICFFLLIFFSVSAYAEHVRGYMRKDGTYVAPYERSEANDTVRDNYSYKGNLNPYTGEEGYSHYHSNPSSEYYDPSSKRSNDEDDDEE